MGISQTLIDKRKELTPIPKKQLRSIETALMLLDTESEAFDAQQIDNRRFMYAPQTDELILGYQYSGRTLQSSHAQEHFDSGAKAPFDSFIRGWIGTGREYPGGVIHFAPNIDGRNAELFDRAYSTLLMFRDNGAKENTVIRGFGSTWEQPLQNIIPTEERSKSMSELDTSPLTLTGSTVSVKEITEQLEQGVKDLFESERYRDYLTAMSKFHDYSINNTLLIMMQRPDASLVAGFSKWKTEFERHVKRGEKGMKILAPAPYKIKKEQEQLDPDTKRPILGTDGKPVTEEKEITIPAFKLVTVFDVAQTEGKEIPDISVDTLTGSVEQYEDFWRALKEVSPVPVALEKIESGAHGYYHLEDKRIAIDEGMSELQTIKTLIHEVAHAKLHDIDLNAPLSEQERPDRRSREVEAESVAYTVCQHYGLDTSDYSFGYVAGWSSGKDIKELKASLETIRKTANELITEIDGHLAELQQERAAVPEQAQPVFAGINPEQQQATRDEVQTTLQMLADADMQSHGEISQATLDAIAAQGYLLKEGIIQRGQPGMEKWSEAATAENAPEQPGLPSDDVDTYLPNAAPQQELAAETAEKTPEGIAADLFDLMREHDPAFMQKYEDQREEQVAATVESLKNSPNDTFAIEAMLIGIAQDGTTEEVRGRASKLLERIDAYEDLNNSYAIYQLKRGEETRDYRFEPLDRLRAAGRAVDRKHYDLVYTAPLATVDAIDPLENIYSRFNVDHPADFTGHSLSVSDIVVLRHGENETAHYCDSFGFTEVPEFLQQEQTAQKQNSIDTELATHAGEKPLPSLDPAVQPVVTILWSESDTLQDGDQMSLARADALFKTLDDTKRAERERPGYVGGWYDKTKFRIDFTFQGEADSYEGRQDFGDGDGSLIEHIEGYHTYYAQDESYKNQVIHNNGKEAWEQEQSHTDMLLHEFIPYLKLHKNLYEMEQTAAQPLEQSENLTPEQSAYFNAVLSHVDACREKLNHGDYILPDPPNMERVTEKAEMDAYRDHVEKEIAQEAEAAGMTVEQYAENGYAPAEQPAEAAPPQPVTRYYPINEDAARRALEANSYRDYVPGSATAEYRREVDATVELGEAQKKRVDPMYHEKIDALVDTYARKLAANINHRYAIDARVPSILITGGSNFPVGKKAKQNAARDTNMEEWQSIQGLLDKIRSTGRGGISADDPQAVQKLQAKLEKLEQAQEIMKATNAYYRKNKTLDGCPALTPAQITKLQTEMSQSWHTDPKPFESFALSNNNAEIHRIRARVEQLQQKEERSFAGWEFDGGRVEANKPDNRLQVFFDEKPDAATRDALKAGGFRWAPSAGAWQRQLNANAYRAADGIACIQPLSGQKPSQLQRQTQQPTKPEAELVPDHFVTGEQITTPRGSFYLTSMSAEQMRTAGYGLHHKSEDGKYLIMGNGTQAFAVAAEQESHIKTAEMSTEQNYNMIDGIMNNTPTVDELEKQVKQGQSISLRDLATAIKAENSERPSIRAQLKASREKPAEPKKDREKTIKTGLERD